MDATTAAAAIPAGAAVTAAIVTGWFAYAAKRALAQSPETVAGGYSRLVADMRQQVLELSKRVDELEGDRIIDHARIIQLERQVSWLLPRLSSDDRAQFHATFHEPDVPPPSPPPSPPAPHG